MPSAVPSPERQRVDWAPGPAARQALDIAQQLRPDLGRQALVDHLVILGLWALQMRPPQLHGSKRDRWTLPDVLQTLAAANTIPGNSAPAHRKAKAAFPGLVDVPRQRSYRAQP